MRVLGLLWLFCLIYVPVAFSHSGGTNAEGCHTESRTGDYHCHNNGEGSGGTFDGSSVPSASTGEEQRNGASSLCSNYALCMEFGKNSIQLQRYSLAISYFEYALIYVPQDKAATVSLNVARSLLPTISFSSSSVTLPVAEKEEVYTSNVCLNYESCMQFGASLIQSRKYVQAIPYFEVALLYKPQDRAAMAGLNIAHSLQPKILSQ